MAEPAPIYPVGKMRTRYFNWQKLLEMVKFVDKSSGDMV